MKNQPEIHFVKKGWGFEKIIVNKPEYCGKLLYMVKGRRASLHVHYEKDEVFFLQSGKIKLFFTDELEIVKRQLEQNKKDFIKNPNNYLQYIILERGSNFHIPPGRVHQMVALEDTELFEFSTEHKEEDSIRLIKGD